MAEAILKPFDPPVVAAPAGVPARAVNGARLRWEPGPDELRLPSCDDEPVSQNTRQGMAIAECAGSLQYRWDGRQDVFVGFDQFLYWKRSYRRKRTKANAPLAPDVYVVFGVANRHRESYVVWEEGKPPDFVLEVVSPSSRKRDTTEKPRRYAKIGVREFFLHDPYGKLDPALAGFELRRGLRRRYRRIPAERLANGVMGVPSKVLGLYLCIRPSRANPMVGSLVWYDPAAGEFLPTRPELGARADAAETRADASDARADASDAEAKAAVARADASDAEAKAAVARADASDARAETAEARADTSDARADAAEARADTSDARAGAAEARADAMAAELAAVKAQIEKTRSERG